MASRELISAMLGGGQQVYSPEAYDRAVSALQGARQAPIIGPWTGIAHAANRAIAKRRLSGMEEAKRQAEAQRMAGTAQALDTFLKGGGSRESLVAALATPGLDHGAFMQAAAQAKALMPSQKPRATAKGADGYLYYTDTGERVLPNVQKAPASAPGIVGEWQAARAAGAFSGSLEDYAQLRKGGVTVNLGPKAPSGWMFAPGSTAENPKLLPIPGGPAEKIPEAQARAAQAAQEIGNALSVLESPGEGGRPIFMEGTNPIDALNPTAFGKSADRERYEQAMESAVQMILRMETGAAATESEVERTMKRYAPRPGDEPATIGQKLQSLKERGEQAARLSGPAYEPLFGQRTPSPTPPFPPPAATGPAPSPPTSPMQQMGAVPGAQGPAPPSLEQLEAMDPAQMSPQEQDAWLNAVESALNFVVPEAGAADDTRGAAPAPGFTLAPNAPSGRGVPEMPVTMRRTASVAGVPEGGAIGPMRQTRNVDTGRRGGPGAGPALAPPPSNPRIVDPLPGDRFTEPTRPTETLPDPAMHALERVRDPNRPTDPLPDPEMVALMQAVDPQRPTDPLPDPETVARGQARAVPRETDPLPDPRMHALERAREPQRPIDPLPPPEGLAARNKMALDARANVSKARNIPANIKEQLHKLIKGKKFGEAMELMRSHIALDRDRASYEAARRLQTLANVTAI